MYSKTFEGENLVFSLYYKSTKVFPVKSSYLSFREFPTTGGSIPVLDNQGHTLDQGDIPEDQGEEGWELPVVENWFGSG